MRYHEERERSAEILRMALAFMGRQAASFDPAHYALWYEHCAGLNPALSRTLETKLAAHAALTDDEIWRLYSEHIAARDQREQENLRGELYRILKETEDHTHDADDRAAQFDEALAGHQQRLASSIEPEALREAVADLRGDTVKMRAMTTELSAKLKASVQEVTVLTESLKRAQSEALLDPLTGLKNRRGFEQAAQELQLPGGELGATSLLIADIDHFKQVNDEHGHLLGDKVLRAIAHILRTSIKGRDIAARLGGEEFVILLPETSAEGAMALARQICTTVAQGRIRRNTGEGAIGQVTLSVGIAVARPGELLEGLIERADAAMYLAKRRGRNRVELSAT